MLAGFRSRYTICRLHDDDDVDGGGDDDHHHLITNVNKKRGKPVHVLEAENDLGGVKLHLVLVEHPVLGEVVVQVT